MDPAHVFRQGLGSVAPRQYHTNAVNLPKRPPRDYFSDDHELADGSSRIAHTLTACCRCRQRKTRCDPTLPRCLPCERSGSTCEYLDTTKGRKINRYYVIKLQEKVRALEAELSQYVDDEGEYPRNSEDIIRPGGMVRLGTGDETPRYLGPSSGIAMTRLLMEEAKRFTESNRISDLIPALRARRQARMQSIQMTSQGSGHKKSYPMTSELPAKNLPGRQVTDKLVEIFNQKSQVFWPILHEKVFQTDLEAVYNGDTDIYKLFVVRMVIAISLQKLEDQYAGLADSYYLAAMQDFETVLRPKDLKTLQCLALIGHYSMITPTRAPVYFVLGLAARICQQEGLVDEKTITAGYDLNPLTIDMRRRLVWAIASMEYGLAHSLGRPNCFATADEQLDVNFFAAVDDEYITITGIGSGPTSDRKLVAIHMAKMRILQAEVRRTLYERKKIEPRGDSSPWFDQMGTKLKDWLDTTPENPPWAKSWFLGRYHQMRISMYRPSPQISKPSPRAAQICFDSARFIIDQSVKQVQSNSVDITWIFLLVLNMSLNTLLWTTSYAEVRHLYAREEVEALVEGSLDVLDRCAERWPGTDNSSQLYAIFSKACLQSYEADASRANAILTTPPPISEASHSPDGQFSNAGSTPRPHYLNPPNPPQFGQVFDASPESMNTFAIDPNFPPHPTFRSNSIFQNPGSMDMHGRRFSYFPPDFTQLDDAGAPEDPTPPSSTPEQIMASPPNQMAISQLPTPPESLGSMPHAVSPPNYSSGQSHNQTSSLPASSSVSPPTKRHHVQPQTSQRVPPYQMPPSSHPAPSQRPLPQQPPSASANWFTPPAPFISAYNFGTTSAPFFGDGINGSNVFGDISNPGLGLQDLGPSQGGQMFGHAAGRQGSLTHTQQLELMNVLETEGMGDIDAFLSAGSVQDGRWY